MIKTTSITITIYTLLLIGSNGSLTATATATTKANYSLVSYMAPIKLEIQDGGRCDKLIYLIRKLNII